MKNKKKMYLTILVMAICVILVQIRYNFSDDSTKEESKEPIMILEKEDGNNLIYLVSNKDDIKVRYYTVTWPPHGSEVRYALFYKEKEICSDIRGVHPNLYLLSPDKKMILYINTKNYKQGFNKNYEIYCIEKNSFLTFPETYLIVGLNDKIEWQKNKILLTNDNQIDSLDLNDSTLKITKLNKGTEKEDGK